MEDETQREEKLAEEAEGPTTSSPLDEEQNTQRWRMVRRNSAGARMVSDHRHAMGGIANKRSIDSNGNSSARRQGNAVRSTIRLASSSSRRGEREVETPAPEPPRRVTKTNAAAGTADDDRQPGAFFSTARPFGLHPLERRVRVIAHCRSCSMTDMSEIASSARLCVASLRSKAQSGTINGNDNDPNGQQELDGPIHSSGSDNHAREVARSDNSSDAPPTGSSRMTLSSPQDEETGRSSCSKLLSFLDDSVSSTPSTPMALVTGDLSPTQEQQLLEMEAAVSPIYTLALDDSSFSTASPHGRYNHTVDIMSANAFLFSKRKYRCSLVVATAFVVVCGLGLWVAVCGPRWVAQTRRDGRLASSKKSSACNISIVYDQCGNPVEEGTLHTIPQCFQGPYNELRRDWIPTNDPGFQEPIVSCSPSNLALFSLTVLYVERQQQEQLAQLSHTANVSASSWQFTERYALATLYFSTWVKGGSWAKDEGWLTLQPVCHWSGVTCNNKLNTSKSGSVVEDLDLHSNGLYGTIPSELSLLSSLKTLNLGANWLQGYVPTALELLTDLEELDLSFGQFVWHLDPWVTNLSNLRKLSLTYSSLSGTLTADIGEMTRLTHLSLHKNRLRGILPSELGLLSNLDTLELTSNGFFGSIPSELGRLTKLTRLEFDHNFLEANLPTEIGLLTELNTLLFEDNHLSGEIPEEVCGLWSFQMKEFGEQSWERHCNHQTYGGLVCPSQTCCQNCPSLYTGSD